MTLRVYLLCCLLGSSPLFADEYYVTLTGNDASGNGSKASPWRTLRFACSQVAPGLGHTINLSKGTFTELRIIVPPGVNVVGAGRDQTILKADQTLHYNPESPGYSTERLLVNLSSESFTAGNQSIKDLTIDGGGKKLHGALYVKSRSNVLIKRVKIRFTNFTGIWLWDVKDSRVTDVQLKDCAWGSSGWCSGAINLADLERVELDHISIDEGTGYGIKSLGSNGNVHSLKIHDSNISVTPFGKWKTDSGAKAPNIAFELWNVNIQRCEFYNNYIDNIMSLVADDVQPSTPDGDLAIHIYNNIMNMETRANGDGYAMEISIPDVEIDHNYILKGKHGIVNWSTKNTTAANWSIHHNVFYGISDVYPAEIVRAQHVGLHNVKFYNNTIEFAGSKTTNLIAIYGGASENVEIINNLIINSTTEYSFYENKLVHLENAVLNNLKVMHNFLVNQPAGTVTGTYKNNITGDPKINKAGSRPFPYYLPLKGSPVIDFGMNVGLPYKGSGPDIGAYESQF